MKPYVLTDDPGLTAILDTRVPTDSMQPMSVAELPDGYTIAVNGTVAMLTLPNGGVCAFDGRLWTRGEKWSGTYRDTPDAPQRARRAAVEAAHAHWNPMGRR